MRKYKWIIEGKIRDLESDEWSPVQDSVYVGSEVFAVTHHSRVAAERTVMNIYRAISKAGWRHNPPYVYTVDYRAKRYAQEERE